MEPRYSSLTNKNILLASEAALKNLDSMFGTSGKYEKLVQCFLFGYFRGNGIKMKMEHFLKGSRRAVDFRFYGDNAALLEIATMRKRYGKRAWEGGSYVNMSELVKLMDQSQAVAKRRILLILDFHNKTPRDIDKIRISYLKKWKSLLRKYSWKKSRIYGITILYVHHDGAKYSITLSPTGKTTQRDLSSSRL